LYLIDFFLQSRQAKIERAAKNGATPPLFYDEELLIDEKSQPEMFSHQVGYSSLVNNNALMSLQEVNILAGV
jgi:hypothetical protein